MSPRKILRCIKTMVFLMRNGETGALLHELRRRIYSTDASCCLRRDLSVPVPVPEARIPIAMRTLEGRDLPAIEQELPRRLSFIRAGVPTCHVATTASNDMVFMQWLLGSESNDVIRDHFGERLPQLAENEVLFEHAYTLEAFRGKRVMPHAMARIAEQAAAEGARWAITFVRMDNVPSLKGCERAGFYPHTVQTITWRLFRHRVSYEPAPESARTLPKLASRPVLASGQS